MWACQDQKVHWRGSREGRYAGCVFYVTNGSLHFLNPKSPIYK